METTCPVIASNLPADLFSLSPVPPPQPQRPLKWLLELETDGTIRYSSIHPQGILADGRDPIVGANFFELPVIGGLSTFRREFAGFVRGDKNRQTFHLQAGNGVYDDPTVVVLTRSYDATESGPSGTVVLMELKSC